MIKRLVVILFVAALMVGMLVPTMGAFALADTPTVLDELQADRSFDASAYPEKEGDYTLDIFQLVETGDSAVIYVYQPSYKDHAVKINMSIAAGVDPQPKLYPLEYLGNSGTLFKYKILEYAKPNADTRYYNIYSIYRNYIAEVDGAPEGDNTINLKALEVGQSIVAKTGADGKVTYDYNRTQVVDVTAQYIGKIRYNRVPSVWDRIFKYDQDVDSHFVAFNFDMDAGLFTDLLEVELTFAVDDHHLHYNNFGDQLIGKLTDLESTEILTAVLSKGERIRDPATLPAKCEYDYYLSERISRSFEFCKDDALSDKDKRELGKYSWVVRFYETKNQKGEYPCFLTKQLYHEYYTDVSTVAILRLKFTVAGKVYNLGAVADVVTGSHDPINAEEPEWPPRWLKILIGVVFGVLILAVLGPVLPYIFKFVIWIVLLPFRAVAAIVKSIRRRKEN